MVTNSDIYNTAVEALATAHLIFIDYDDHLMDEQVEALVDGEYDSVYDAVHEAYSEQRFHLALEDMEDAARAAIRTLITDDEDEEEAWEEFEASDYAYELRSEVECRDESDPVKDLAGRTWDPLVQYVPDEPIEITIGHPDGGYSSDDVHEALKKIGLPDTDANVDRLSSALDNCHDYATIRPIFTVDLSELLDPSVEFVRLGSPTLLCLNPFDGSGMDTEPMQGTIDVPRDQIALDSALGYGSWDAIAGVVVSAYAAERTEYVRICRYRFEGTDTDGTDYYLCESHGSTEPSPQAHCGEAEEPAYAMLITDKKEN